MEPLSFTSAAWVAGAIGLAALGARAARRRPPRRGSASAGALAAAAPAVAAPVASVAAPGSPATAEGADPGRAAGAATGAAGRRLELRMEAIEAAQAALAGRLDGAGGAEAERLQAMAGQILGLVRDKAASLETALAGLDQLRARLRVLEQMGAPAEARALVEALEARLAAAERERGVLEARLARLETAPSPLAEVSERLAALHAQKDLAVEAALGRLAPLEAKLAEVEATLAARDPRGALERFGERLDAAQRALGDRLSALEGAPSPLAEVSERLAALHAQKDLAVEAALGRLAPLEAKLAEVEAALAARDPRGALERFGERLDAARSAQEALAAALGDRVDAAQQALGDRLSALEGAPSPLAEVSERLAALHAQKDLAVEAALGRLAPLEAKLAEVEASLAARDPRGALERFGERLDAAQQALGDRLSALEGAPSPLAEVSERLAALHAQKDLAVEAALGRLAPLEAKLAEVEAALAARDPRGALERFGERLDAAQQALGDRLGALEGASSPLAEVSERLAALHAQKDLAVEAALGRLAPLEAKLAEVETMLAARDPREALERFGERLDAARSAQEALASAIGDRLTALEGAPSPLAEVSERLAALHAQKDLAVEAALGRLAPLEAKLAEVETMLAARDPRGALERFGERLDAAQQALGDRLTALEGAPSPLAEVSERLAALHAQKDLAVEAALGRLAPLEAKLAEVEATLAAHDPRGALERFGERIEAARSAQEALAAALGDRLTALEGAPSPLAEVSERLAALHAQKDLAVEAALGRLAPLEAKLAEVEATLAARDPRGALERFGERIEALQGRVDGIEAGAADAETEAARAEAQAIAAQLVAARTVAAETRLFADRIALLEASLPRLSLAQALMMQALERQAAPAEAGWPPAAAAEAAPAHDAMHDAASAAARPVEDEEPWRMPRVVSVHTG